MKSIKAQIKRMLTRVMRIVLTVILSVLFFIVAFCILSVLFFFLFYFLGAYPMDYIDSEAGRMLFHVVIMLIYFVAFILEGAVLGFYTGTYIQMKKAIKNFKMFSRIFEKVMEKLYILMKKKGYINTTDFDKHRGKERVSLRHTEVHMNALIDEVVSEESGGVGGLFSSPVKFVSLKFSDRIMKRLGNFMLKRMSITDKSGESVIFLDVMDWAVQKGMWGFAKKYLLTPLLLFCLASTGVFVLLILLPIGLCHLLAYIF